MDRKVPDVFDVFGIGGPYVPNTPKGGIALPGLVAVRDESNYCWSERLSKQNDKWREGRSQCERPRTYDKFYQKTPGNFQALDPAQTDSAVSMCSSDNEYSRDKEEDKDKDKRRRRGKRILDKTLKERRSSKTLTEQDIKHIERHLSMKRTIRKKIMRDLQSNLVLGPSDDLQPLPCDKEKLEKLGYSESNILDMLRDSQDSGHDSPHRDRKFRSCRVVRRRRKSSHFDSSSEELCNIFQQQNIRDPEQKMDMRDMEYTVRERAVDVPDHPHHHQHSLHSYHSLVEPPPDYDDSLMSSNEDKVEKKSFWKRLIGRKK